MRVEVAFEPPPLQPFGPSDGPGGLQPMRASHIDALTGDDEMAIADINATIEAGGLTPRALAPAALSSTAVAAATAVERRDPHNPSTWGKVGRNEACPCGSGKKYKHCHGAFG
jgi:preprotein translocase subunit SecA